MIATTVVDPEKIAWTGEASKVVFAIGDGQVGILPGHADATFALAPCLLRITPAQGAELKFFVSGGVARVEKGKLTLLADSAETQEQIDRQRAERAKERAEKRLKESQSVDFDRARLALARALLRLELAH